MRSPFTGGSATKKSKTETFTFRNEEFTVTRWYYQCDDTGRTFTDSEVDTDVMDEIYSLYRKRHNIPSSSELKELRERYKLSAHTMSKIAGLGVNQYGLYENGEMPSLGVGRRLSALFDKDTLIRCIDEARGKLGEDYAKVRAKVTSYREPEVYELNRSLYNQFYISEDIGYPPSTYPIKKARWVSC